MKLTSALTALGAAAGIALTAAPATAEITGSVEVAGSSTVYPISTFVGEQFTKAYPQVSVNIQKIGSGGGFKQFIAGNTDASNASRLIKAKEIQAAADNGIEFIEMLVAYDGLSIVIPGAKNSPSITSRRSSTPARPPRPGPTSIPASPTPS